MGKQLFICKNCGKEYHSYKDSSNFCSKECMKSYNNILYKCDYCGKDFYIYKNRLEKLQKGIIKHIYCCRDCANKAQFTSVEKTCEYCGKKYFITKSFSDIQNFCSRECYDNFRTDNAKIFDKICPICNSKFQTNIESQIYCGNECKGISQQKRIECICDNCGKHFNRIVSEVEKNKKHFCSKECMYDYIGWSLSDINILKDNYNKISKNKVQELLSKKYSIKAINSKARALNLTKTRLWTRDETDFLINNYDKLPFYRIQNKLQNRTTASILGKARSLNLFSYFYINSIYSNDEIKYLSENYLDKSNLELAKHLNRSESAISQKLMNLGLYRPNEICKDGYKRLNEFVRARLYNWKNEVRKLNNYKCCVTGKNSNLIIHHCRSFNILIQETIEVLNFNIKDNFSDYNDDELLEFLETFLNLQEYYGEYVCITESIHRLFHSIYGYGDNTIEQWNDFIEKYT